jgi:hypothetical protein
MEPITLAAIALGGAFLLGGKKNSGTSVHKGGWGVKGSEDRVYWLNEIRSMSQWYSNEYGSMPFLADYLTVVGFIESNFNPAAINTSSDPSNAARGLFGERPDTFFKEKYGLQYMRPYPNALMNPRWAFVTAVHHIWVASTRVYEEQSGVIDWAAVRRWWGIPGRVHDFSFEHSYSSDNLGRFEDGLHKCNEAYGTNIDPDFVWVKISGWQNYPGLGTMIKSFGLQGVYA